MNSSKMKYQVVCIFIWSFIVTWNETNITKQRHEWNKHNKTKAFGQWKCKQKIYIFLTAWHLLQSKLGNSSYSASSTWFSFASAYRYFSFRPKKKRKVKSILARKKKLRMWIFGWKGPSGYSSRSTAEQVTQGIDGTGITAVVTGLSFSSPGFSFFFNFIDFFINFMLISDYETVSVQAMKFISKSCDVCW